MLVGRAPAAKFGDRKQSDSYSDMYACEPLSVSVTTQTGGRSLEVLRGLAVLIAAKGTPLHTRGGKLTDGARLYIKTGGF